MLHNKTAGVHFTRILIVIFQPNENSWLPHASSQLISLVALIPGIYVF